MAGMSKSEAGRLGGKASSRKGIPNKRTTEAEDKLAKLGCDPLELSAHIALGQELDGPHPGLVAFQLLASEMRSLSESGKPLSAKILDRLDSLIAEHLTGGFVPIELRSKHIVDLMRYIYPQRKAVDFNATLDDKRPPSIDPSTLSTNTLNELLEARLAAAKAIEGELVDEG